MFKKMEKRKYPLRRWTLAGPAGGGKTFLASQFGDKLLIVDSDHRFEQFLDVAKGEIYQLSDNPYDSIDAAKIASLLRENMPTSGIYHVVIDTLTAIIKPLVTEAIVGNDAGTNKNRFASFKPKAMAMQQIGDALNAYAPNFLVIYHVYDSVDINARGSDTGATKEATTITAVELARLRRHLNMALSIVFHPTEKIKIKVGDGFQEIPMRGVRLDWTRRGRSGITIWDKSGTWRGICEKIEAEAYDGLTKEDMDTLENAIPTTFASPEEAIAWADSVGCFNDAVHTKKAYDKLKEEKKPKTAADMWRFWIADVLRRRDEHTEDDIREDAQSFDVQTLADLAIAETVPA